MKRLGKVVGVCVSQRRIDPKENVGKGLLQRGVGLVGDSHAGTEKTDTQGTAFSPILRRKEAIEKANGEDVKFIPLCK